MGIPVLGDTLEIAAPRRGQRFLGSILFPGTTTVAAGSETSDLEGSLSFMPRFLATIGRRMVYSPAFRPERRIVSGRRPRSVGSKMDSFSYAPVHGSPGC